MATETKKTVADDMRARVVLPTPEEATAYLTKCGTELSDFGDMVLAAPGLDMETGEFNPDVYTPEMEILVTKLTRQKTAKNPNAGVKAIVVAPIPTLDALLSSDSGRAFVQAIIHKELNHRAVRVLRDADDVSTMISEMPTTISGYIESSRGDAGIMEAFNEIYKKLNAALSAKLPVWSKARLIKSELKKALESKGYAAEYYPALEDYKGQSLFVVALDLAVSFAKRSGIDPTIFERWKETRDAKPFDAAPDEDDDDFDLDSLTDAMDAEGDDVPTSTESNVTE